MTVSGQAAVIEYHRLGGLNNAYLFLRVIEARKSKIKMSVISFPGESPLPGL